MTDASTEADEVILVGAPAPTKKRHQLSNNETLSPLNIAFLASTIGGLLSEYLESPGFAVLCIAAFVAYGCLKRESLPSLERFADAAYYQGFILTLFALLLALTGRAGHTLTSDGIIGQFGLAIWTTFAGMTARIVIIQFFTTASDQEGEARQSIDNYIDALNTEIATALSQMRTFRESVLESAAKITADLAEESKQTRKESSDSIKASMAALVRSVDQTTKKLDSAMERVTARIADLQLPEDALSAPLARLAQSFASDLNSVKMELEQGARNFADTMTENVVILEGARTGLGQLRQSLGDVNESITTASTVAADAIKEAQAKLATASTSAKGVEQLGRTAEALAQRLTLLSGALDVKGRSYAAALDAAAAENRAVNEELSATLTEGVKKITQAVRDARPGDAEGN